ncbi:MAG TPA: hypothetical protein VK400_14725 [Pyrinomonadaceae bacterium]|nr:hypothetical protein [Pyrinomonadaceae bacterium]
MRNFSKILLVICLACSAACQRNIFQSPTVAPATLRDVPALKLNFRFEPDVPPPSTAAATANQPPAGEERVPAVQNDFDTNRPQEVLDKTLSSPDKQRVLAVYHKTDDLQSEFRLDMYSADGRLLRKITPGGLAVHFPDTIVWSPDSTNIAFVGMIRVGNQSTAGVLPTPALTEPTPAAPDSADADTNTDANGSGDANANANVAAPAAATPQPPASVLTFRTEQIYLCNADGGDLKPITQNEGLIYFYFAWSPDGAALATLAATIREWQFGQIQAEQRMELFMPSGRPRLVEKTGRIRLLDDNLTKVHPVWSPDSAKVAVAFDKDVRIYDAIGDAPTQAAIPLRNPLLLSSKKYDDELRAKEQGAANAPPVNTNTEASALPDENMLVSYNPIIELEWSDAAMLYLQTGYIREMKNTADSARSYLRWHRLILSPQPIAL